MPSLSSIDSLRYFLAAARALNFRQAARVVALTPTAFGQRIKQLEAQLGTALLLRTTRSVSLTEAGLALIPSAEQCIAAAARCERIAGKGRDTPPMSLTLGTRQELGMSWVLPLRSALMRSRPWLDLNLYFGSGADLLLRVRTLEIDCAITSTRFSDPKLDAFQLHREDYVFVGARKLLEKHALQRAKDAAHHTLLDATPDMPLFRYWKDARGGGTRTPFLTPTERSLPKRDPASRGWRPWSGRLHGAGWFERRAGDASLRQARTGGLSTGDSSTFALSPEEVDALRAVDVEQLVAAAALARNHVFHRSHRGVGSLVQCFCETMAAWTAEDPTRDLDDLASDFVASSHFDASRTHPFCGRGISLEAAFFGFAEERRLGDANTRLRECATALLRGLLVTPAPEFLLPEFVVRAPLGFFVILPEGPSLLAILNGRFVEGPITPLIASVLLSVAGGRGSSSAGVGDERRAVEDEVRRLGLIGA